MKTKKYIGYQFESSCYKTEEFKGFARAFRSDVKSMLKDTGIELEAMSVGHFYVSGFVSKQSDNGDKSYVYFSISDVRHFPDEWNNHVLIRTARHLTDFSGGSNNYISLEKLAAGINSLFR